MVKISRAAYADMYGPTTGDKVRLADTELFIEIIATDVDGDSLLFSANSNNNTSLIIENNQFFLTRMAYLPNVQALLL